MEDISKRLVEVECILSQLDSIYKEKIPNELWNYINENKDKNYVFEINNNIALTELNLNIDTISILTYINMQYLLPIKQKKELEHLLNIDKEICEENKRLQYNPDDIFKKKKLNDEEKTKQNSIVKYQEKRFFQKIYEKIKNLFIR